MLDIMEFREVYWVKAKTKTTYDMNRIILVGNGFDLAHNLRTSYKNFIEWYWDDWLLKLRKCYDNIMSDQLCSFTIKNRPRTWQSFFFHNPDFFKSSKGYDVVCEMMKDDLFEVVMCPFLNKICISIEYKKWVDIENEYYQCLLKSDERTTKELNKSFEYIKQKLVEYLRTIKYPNIINEIHALIQTPIRKSDVSISGLNYWNDFMKERCNYSEDEWNQLFSDY